MALQNGEVDFSAESLQAQDIELLKSNDNISFMETQGSRGFHRRRTGDGGRKQGKSGTALQ